MSEFTDARAYYIRRHKPKDSYELGLVNKMTGTHLSDLPECKKIPMINDLAHKLRCHRRSNRRPHSPRRTRRWHHRRHRFPLKPRAGREGALPDPRRGQYKPVNALQTTNDGGQAGVRSAGPSAAPFERSRHNRPASAGVAAVEDGWTAAPRD